MKKSTDGHTYIPNIDELDKLNDLFTSNPGQYRSKDIPAAPALVEQLGGLYTELQNELIELPYPNYEEAFNQQHATTQFELESTPIFQLISFNAGFSQENEIDMWLRESDWGDKALPIGGVFGQLPFGSDLLAVLLRKYGDELLFQFVNRKLEPVYEQQGTLLEKQNEAYRPYSAFTSSRIWYSQSFMQTLMRFDLPVDHGAQEQAMQAVRQLIDEDLLPPESEVLTVGARSSFLWSSNEEFPTPPADLTPNIVVLAARPFDRITGQFVDGSFGDGVIRVLEPIDNFVATLEGETVTLPKGDYRLDILVKGDSPEKKVASYYLGQLVSSLNPEDNYYLPLRAGELMGRLYKDLEQERSSGSANTDILPEIAIDGICLFSYCSSIADINTPLCPNNRNLFWVTVCIGGQ